MKVTKAVRSILNNYKSDNPGTKAKLAQMLMHGKLAGTGRMIIYPVDQGFEHGPIRSFSHNDASHDPLYHFQLAKDSGASAFAAPLGMLEAGADQYAGEIPLILKMNSANTLTKPAGGPNQALTASVKDAVRLGCVGVGFTLYPGSSNGFEMQEELKDIILEAKENGLAVIVWSYARGDISKQGETALDVTAYGAHMACLMGAHIVKVKLPSDYIEFEESAKLIKENNIAISTMEDRVRYIVKSCFDGRRMVIFSGGEAKDDNAVIEDAKAIRLGGGNGSIIGRNLFKRPKTEAIELFNRMADIYKKAQI